MKKLLNFKSIKAKILFGFSIVISLVLILGVFNFFSTNKINSDTKDIVDHQLPLLIADEKLAFNMAQRIALTRGYILYGDEDYKTRFNEYTESSKEHQDAVLALSESEEVKTLIDKSIEWRQLVITSVFAEYDQGNVERANEILINEVQPLAREIMTGFEELATEREALIKEEGESILAGGKTLLYVGMGISILVVILGIIAALVTGRVISDPVNKVMQRMEQIANGDLSLEPLESNSRDEIGKLITSTNLMNENMRQLLNQVNEVSETVGSQSEELTQSASEVKAGSQQVAVTMQELASGSESQATNASALSSIMQTFAAKVQEANTNGEEIYNSSNQVLTMTTEGSQLMERSVEQMATIDQIVQEAVQKVKGLDAQSQEISKLVSVIKDIADQTNLLALNAAIEAARAGEHGKGFAVVADEVRKLAEQVGVSVTDITSIVQSIQTESTGVAQSLQGGYHEVEKGTEQIKTTGETFTGINGAVQDMVGKIKLVTDNLSTIATNSQEMNASVEEIAAVSEEAAAGVEQTSASAQQTSSSMEEVADSSDELAKLAEELNELIRQFKL